MLKIKESPIRIGGPKSAGLVAGILVLGGAVAAGAIAAENYWENAPVSVSQKIQETSGLEAALENWPSCSFGFGCAGLRENYPGEVAEVDLNRNTGLFIWRPSEVKSDEELLRRVFGGDEADHSVDWTTDYAVLDNGQIEITRFAENFNIRARYEEDKYPLDFLTKDGKVLQTKEFDASGNTMMVMVNEIIESGVNENQVHVDAMVLKYDNGTWQIGLFN